MPLAGNEHVSEFDGIRATAAQHHRKGEMRAQQQHEHNLMDRWDINSRHVTDPKNALLAWQLLGKDSKPPLSFRCLFSSFCEVIFQYYILLLLLHLLLIVGCWL